MGRVTSQPERIDPHGGAAFDRWYDAFWAGDSADREYPTAWAREDLRASVLRPGQYREEELYAVRDGSGAVVGAAYVELPIMDNLSKVSLMIAVPPEHRRRGIATALLTYVEQRALADGRTTVLLEVDAPIEGGVPGQAFAAGHGYTVAVEELHLVLELPQDVARLEALAKEAAERHAGYQLVSWVDRAPDDLVDAVAALHASFVTEVPFGELDWEPEPWDAARVREQEDRLLARNRTTWVTAAVAPDGSLAGFTELVAPGFDPGNVTQWGTLVQPAHRGHRLGLALKARNHLELHHARPEPAVVHTWNGTGNDHMVAVNDKLGFRPVELNQEWQKHL